MEIELEIVATGLRFPEGPVALPDGSVALVEIQRGTVSRVDPKTGEITVVAEPGGGPNGLAVGPDGAWYVCNNGGFIWHEIGPFLLPGNQPPDYSGGRIERIDPETGAVEVLYDSCDGHALRGPNDLVFDAHGGFWFTDHGKVRDRDRDNGGIYYAQPDGSSITEVIYPLESPNGIGLSPDGARLYAVETHTGRVWGWDVSGPGTVSTASVPGRPGDLIVGLPGMTLLDSLAVDGAGNVCVATLGGAPGITIVSPDGSFDLAPTPDPLTTNICFSNHDLTEAWITLSATGQLARCRWPSPGLKLNH